MKSKILLILIIFYTLIQLNVVNAQKVVSGKKSVAPLFKDNSTVYFKFKIQNKKEIETLTRIISIDNVKGLEVYAYATTKQFADFLTYNYQYELISDNNSIDNTLFPPETRATTTWNFYPTYDAYDTIMTAFQTNYPNICRKINLKTLTSGRKLLFCKISKNPDIKEAEPRILYTSSMHGNEITGYVLMLHLIDYLLSNYGIDPRITRMIDSTEIWINPLANPDGTYHAGNSTVYGAIRNNQNNVDLNRNYPDFIGGPHSDNLPYQQETMAFMGLADSLEFTESINFHGGSQVCNYPWDGKYAFNPDDAWWQYVCRAYADTVHTYSGSTYLADLNNGITNGAAWYLVYGGRQDYMNYYHHCREFTLEISTTKTPAASQLPTYWTWNYPSLLNYIDEAQYGIRGIVTDSTTGLPLRAKVYIKGHDADSTEVNTYMPNGNYHRPVFAGNYNVTYYAKGYSAKTYNITAINKQAATLNVSLNPFKITGPSTVCKGQNNIVYTLIPIPDTASFTWILPTGFTGSSSSNTININVANNALSGNIKVIVLNKLGYSDTISLAVNTITIPDTAVSINGFTSVFQGQNNVTYLAPSIPNATTYNWTLPLGFSGSSTSNSIIINFANNALPGNISVNGINACGVGLSKTIHINTLKSLQVKAFIEGFYNSTNGNLNKVQDDIGDHFGTDTVDAIKICLAQSTTPYLFTDTLYGFINTSGIINLGILSTKIDSSFIVIKHRNSIETWSANSISFNSNSIYYDFTDNINKTYGPNEKQVSLNTFAIYSGDVNQDGVINIFDLAAVFDYLNDQNAPGGYLIEDINGDSVVNIYDLSMTFDNLNSGISVSNPIIGLK